jgi:hypothetical protein
VAILPDIALVINISKSYLLPSHQTPFKVFFGWKPHWIGALPLDDSDTDVNSVNGDDNDNDKHAKTDVEDLEITEIEA